MSSAPWKPRKAVLLVNLGTTSAPTAPAVRRFLREFLSDRRVIDVPRFIWYPILYGLILPFRPRKVAPLYEAIWIKHGSGVVINGKTEGSPLSLYSESLTLKVQAALSATHGDSVVVRHALRYGDMSIPAVLKALHEEFPSVRELVVLPLFPQYTSTTSACIYDEVFKFYTDTTRRCVPGLRTIRDYAENPVYIEAISTNLIAAIKAHVTAKAGAPADWKAALAAQLDGIVVIITYHSIPVRYVVEHDDYPERCEATTAAIKAYLEAEAGLSFTGTLVHVYQSLFGKEPWIGPTLVAAAAAMPLPVGDPLKEAFSEAQHNKAIATKQATTCFAIAPGFAVDCVETSNEIALGAREVFEESGGQHFVYVPCLNDSDAHVRVLTSVLAN